jgi:microcystin-dependent protein
MISSALNLIKSWANGGIDANNLTAAAFAMLGTIPIGGLMQYAASTDPVDNDGVTRWLICDGRAINRGTYGTLFGRVGTTYGSGDGSTTFNIPDLRGRVPVGADSGGAHLPVNHPALGASGGEENHTLSTTEMPSHSHTLTGSHYVTNIAAQTYVVSTGSGNSLFYGATYSTGPTDNAGGGGAHNNLQPYLAVNHIIRVQ